MKIRALNGLVLLVLLLVSACVNPTTQDQGTIDSAVIATAVAQTMAAQRTLQAGGTAVAQLTQMVASPSTASLDSPGKSPLSSITPEPPAAPAEPSQTPIPIAISCDWAQFMEDVTVADGSIFAPKAVFNKTWRLKNIGSCTWTSDYALVFVSGASMGTLAVTSLPQNVSPYETIDLTVKLTAPSDPGSYQGNWMLRNASGTLFGAGEDGRRAFSAQIQVIPNVNTIESAYDFTANFCSADWHSGAGALPCPGESGDANGFVTLLNQPVLESGKTYDLSILTRPDQDLSGWISGQFPYYQVNDGDRFRAEIGCLDASQGCDVTFQLEYQTSNRTVMNLGTWRESYDGQTTILDLNLSALAGQNVQLITSVRNNGRPGSANAFWHQARIQNVSRPPVLVLTWNRELGENETCDELRVYLSAEDSGSAQALDCLSGHRELGWTSLTSDEVEQFQEWVSSLTTFDAEVYKGSPQEGGVSWMDFRGAGDADPRDSHIRAIDELASELFAVITGVD